VIVQPQDRELDHLNPTSRPGIERFLAAVRAAGFEVLVVETFRTAARQAYLYAQGRTRPGAIITYTLDSAHEYGLAIDWVPLVRNAKGEWVPSWDVALYQRIYAAVPPAKFGLETLSFERPHVQLAGVNGPRQNIDVSVYARAHGIQANVIVGSRWPAAGPAPIVVPAKPPSTVVPGAAQHRIMIPDGHGGWLDATGRRVPLPPGLRVINATDDTAWLGY